MQNKLLGLLVRVLALLAGSLALSPTGWGYVLRYDQSGIYVVKWQDSPVPFQVKLSTAANLSDGNSQASSVVAAMQAWNVQLGTLRFAPTVAGPGAYGIGNDVNEIVMDRTVDGESFGSGTLAVTVSFKGGNALRETDIVFNTAYTWGSYRGALSPGVEDIQRVGIHELGHALGLGHPDENGQSVNAIMNSRESAVDSLRADDINGGQELYGAPGFKPANDNFANAVSITLGSSAAKVFGSNIAATREPGEPDHADVAEGHSVWWKWTAPSNGNVVVTTLGSNFDTVLAAYTGTGVAALSKMDANDDEETPEQNPSVNRKRTSRVTFPATRGTTYYLAVDGWGNVSEGQIPYTGTIILNLNYASGNPPVFISQPASKSCNAGEVVPFSVVVSDSPGLAYQWQRLPAGEAAWINLTNSGGYSGVNTATLSVNTTVTMSGDQLRCLATNGSGATASDAVTLTVAAVPVAKVSQFTFYQDAGVARPYVGVSGVGPFSYQWYHNGVAIPNSNTNSLTINSSGGTEMGEYFVAVTNPGGTVLGPTKTLGLFMPSVHELPPAHWWLKAREADGVIYFLFASPARIARYDLATESWLSPWTLDQTPADFAISADAIYVTAGPKVLRYGRNFGAATTLVTADKNITAIQLAGDTLVTMSALFSSTVIDSYDRLTGRKIDTRNLAYYFKVTFNYSPLTGKIYGCSPGYSLDPIPVQSDGTFGNYSSHSLDSSIYPTARQTFVLGAGDLIIDEGGMIRRASDLTYAGSLGDRITDVVSTGTTGYYVLREGRISVTDGSYRETGSSAGHIAAARFWRKNSDLILFAQPASSGGTPATEKVPASVIRPSVPGAPGNPANANLIGAQLLMDEVGVVYIYSKLDRCIYRWSSVTRNYLPSIPLPNNPNSVAYSADNRSIYCEENSHQIRRIALDSGDLSPLPFSVTPGTPVGGLQAADQYLLVAAPSAGGNDELHETYSPAGTLITLATTKSLSRAFAWCAATRRMYYFNDRSSSPYLLSEVIDSAGNITNETAGASYGDLVVSVPPIRVTPDGSKVALGSGYVFDGLPLTRAGILANSFVDGVWSANLLHTVRATGAGAEMQTWSGDQLLPLRDRSYPGTPLGLMMQPDGRLLLITVASGALVYRVLDTADLKAVYAPDLTTKAAQTISFGALSDRTYGDAPFSVGASASSGLPVEFGVVGGPATVSGNTVTITGAGTVSIRARQSGDATFDAATGVAQSFTVGRASLTVTAANQTRVYGSDQSYVPVSYSGFVNNDTAAVLTNKPEAFFSGRQTQVGTYPVVPAGGVSDKYEFTYVNGTVTITKTPLTVRANDVVRLQGVENPPLTLSYTGFVNGQNSTVLTAQPAVSTTATVSSPFGVYPITVTGGSADNYEITRVNGVLRIVPPSYGRTFFGTFASGGHWALYVRVDGSATYLAYLPNRSSAVVVNFTVATDGSFSVAGTEIKKTANAAVGGLALSLPEAPAVRTAAAAGDFTLTGQIANEGAVAGQLTGLAETFTGAVAAATGPAQAVAGLFTASAIGTAGGATYAIVGASGQAVIVTTTPTAVDGAVGTVNSNGQLTVTTSNNASLSLTINSSAQTVSATLKPSGSATPIGYAGLAATVTPVARVVNLSVRTAAGTGDQTLIVGLVIIGSGNKTLLVRGIGPTLSTQGVANPLADPTMRLLNGSSAEVAANNDWGGSAPMSAHFAAVGAFALPANSKDAALFNALPTGLYSFHTFPNGAGAGVVLAEVYDADDDTSAASVFNISARTQVGTGENILIAGFVITGNSPKTLLIRGLGPTLTAQGVTGALANPQLYLFGGSGLVANNDDWGGTAALKNAFAATGAGGLAADTSKDAALLVTLQPGVYSAQVSGVGGTTGVGLVEIFLVP